MNLYTRILGHPKKLLQVGELPIEGEAVAVEGECCRVGKMLFYVLVDREHKLNISIKLKHKHKQVQDEKY